MDWLSIVAKHHKTYITWVHKWGEYDYAEDFVQEMYLKLHQYNCENKCIRDGEVNKSYIWFVLRSVYGDYYKTKKRIEKVRIGEGFEIEYENTDFEEFRALESLLDKIECEKDKWDWYDSMLFNIYMKNKGTTHNRSGEGISMRKLAEETKIPLISIWNTIKNCKKRLNENVGCDFEDYNNGDYEYL